MTVQRVMIIKCDVCEKAITYAINSYAELELNAGNPYNDFPLLSLHNDKSETLCNGCLEKIKATIRAGGEPL